MGYTEIAPKPHHGCETLPPLLNYRVTFAYISSAYRDIFGSSWLFEPSVVFRLCVVCDVRARNVIPLSDNCVVNVYFFFFFLFLNSSIILYFNYGLLSEINIDGWMYGLWDLDVSPIFLQFCVKILGTIQRGWRWAVYHVSSVLSFCIYTPCPRKK